MLQETTPFTLDPTLTGVAIAYTNPAQTLIAGEVLPKVMVATKKFDHLVYDDDSFFTLPDTRLGAYVARYLGGDIFDDHDGRLSRLWLGGCRPAR